MSTIINGRHDRVVPLANAEVSRHRLPNGCVAISDAGHVVWEEPPAECATIILDSITPSGVQGPSRWAIVDSNHGPPPYQSGALTD